MKLRVGDRVMLGLYLASGMKAYPSAKLYWWTPVKYSRKKYRELLNRLRRLNLVQQTVIGGAVHFRLTTSGQKQLLEKFPTLVLVGKAWDGFWRLVIFDIPESRRSERDRLRRRLLALGFGRLQDSLYLSPYDWDEAVFGAKVLFIEAKQKHLGAPADLAKRVWPLEQISRGYQEVIDKLTTRFGIKDKLKRDQFYKKVYEDYLEAVLADPQLPAELVGASWPAQKTQTFIRRAGVMGE